MSCCMNDSLSHGQKDDVRLRLEEHVYDVFCRGPSIVSRLTDGEYILRRRACIYGVDVPNFQVLFDK